MCVETATLGDLPSYGDDKAQSSCVPCGLDGLLENTCILTLIVNVPSSQTKCELSDTKQQ